MVFERSSPMSRFCLPCFLLLLQQGNLFFFFSLLMFNVSPCTGLVCSGLDRLPARYPCVNIIVEYHSALHEISSGLRLASVRHGDQGIPQIKPTKLLHSRVRAIASPCAILYAEKCNTMPRGASSTFGSRTLLAGRQATWRLHFCFGMFCAFGKHMMEPSTASSRALHLT